MAQHSQVKNLGTVIAALLASGCSVVGKHGVEEPVYTVVAASDNKEIRAYEQRIVATTTVSGSWKQAQNKAFRILASYIFGKNQSRQKIAMTAPVEQSQGETIAMTTPVEQTASESGWTIAFTMPASYKLEDLPMPLDDRITLKVIPPQYVAAISYSWYADEEENQLNARALKKWVLSLDEWKVDSNPGFAGYDPPWTLPFFRKNEVMYQVSKDRASH